MDSVLFDSAYLNWLIVAFIFLIVEVSTFTLLFLWLGFAAILMSAVLYIAPDMRFSSQLILFALSSAASVVLWVFAFKNKQKHIGDKRMNNRASRYVGQMATVIQASDGVFAKVRIGDSQWRVRCEKSLNVGDTVSITDTDGVILIVQPKQ